jgi:hypothetical protein
MLGLPKKSQRAGVKTCVVAALPPDRLNAEWLSNRPGKLYPTHTADLCTQKAAAIVENPEAVAEYRYSAAPAAHYENSHETIK